MKNNCFVSSVVYCYNDENNIENFISNISKVLIDNFTNGEIIVVNDCSNDKSVNKIKAIAKKIKGISITLLNMSKHYGIETSMNAGVDLSIGDFVYEFDSASIDYDIKVITDIYNKSIEGFDIVSATPNHKSRKSSKFFYKLFNRYLKTDNLIKTETFKIVSRRALNRIKNANKTIPYRKPIYVNCGLKYTSIEYIPTNDNINSQDKQYRIELAINSLVLFTDMGYRISMAMVAVMSVAALSMIAYTVVVYFSGDPIEGWTTTIAFLSLAFFGLFLILAIVIKYLQIIVDLNFKKVIYNIESIEKLSK